MYTRIKLCISVYICISGNVCIAIYIYIYIYKYTYVRLIQHVTVVCPMYYNYCIYCCTCIPNRNTALYHNQIHLCFSSYVHYCIMFIIVAIKCLRCQGSPPNNCITDPEKELHQVNCDKCIIAINLYTMGEWFMFMLDGRVVGRSGGGQVGWREGRVVGRSGGGKVGWWEGWIVGRSGGWKVGWWEGWVGCIPMVWWDDGAVGW